MCADSGTLSTNKSDCDYIHYWWTAGEQDVHSEPACPEIIDTKYFFMSKTGLLPGPANFPYYIIAIIV